MTLGFSGASNGSNRIFAHNTGGDGLYLASATGRHIAFRTNGGSSETFRMTFDGKLQAGSSNTTILDASRNLQNIASITSGAITTIGSTSDNTADTLTAKDSSNATLFRVRNDGVVLISDNYLYVNSSQGAYFDGTVRCRNGINDDSGQLSIGSSTGDITFNSNDLTNIGTISSGAITTSGSVNLTAGQIKLRNDVALDHDGSSLYVKAPSRIYFYPGNNNKGNIDTWAI